MKLDWLKKYNLITFEEIDSTNSEALRIASSGVVGDFIQPELEPQWLWFLVHDFGR